ncbi:A/G-specific adenine glycosylase [Marinivivus vitaminiproducens]|uniref:A/G-specific adenine glycosylase n=1 Tax=Marinivivus vitaminiproducens TaxID=3035935 RepID=UPI00279EE0CD|nr:A/G-specific adenine glycosylase [Geminicoccaceae bacterium SCSIO 64248]
MSVVAPRAGGGTETAGRLLAALLDWYDQQRRDLPWRAAPGRATDAYTALVSEFMLQQTTAATVRRRFPVFMTRFPSLEALAAAPLEDVLHAWQGLGYYRRARSLHACARAIRDQHGGRLPNEEAALLALPGIGAYTARALQAIVHHHPVVPVDGNVERVLARAFRIETPLPRGRAAIVAEADRLASEERPGDVAQALMELGATVCRPRAPLCVLCPWMDTCAARTAGVAESLPRKAPPPAKPVRRGLAFLLRRSDGAILFRRRPDKGLLAGLHELPGSPWQEGPLELDRALDHAPVKADWRLLTGTVRHVFSHFALDVTLAEARTDQPPLGLWCRPDELGRLALPTVTVKLLRHVGIEPGPGRVVPSTVAPPAAGRPPAEA